MVTSFSPMVTFPLLGLSKPATNLNKVVFPHPEGPRKVKNSPGLISILMFFIT